MRGRTIRRILSVLFVIGVVLTSIRGSIVNAAFPAELTLTCPSPFNVMPIGDSITTGKYSGHNTLGDTPEDDIGYRKDLWDLMNSAGCTINFVGSESNGSTYPFNDPEHEGHNGQTDEYIADNIYGNGGQNWLGDRLAVNQDPDVILLHIGTNTPRDPANVELILDQIDQFESDTEQCVVVVLAQIIDKTPYGQQPIIQYNNDLTIMAQARPDFGSELFMVNMYSGAGMIYSSNPSGDMLDDGIHPFSTGYNKMAIKWKEKFDVIYADGTVNSPPNVTKPADRVNFEGDIGDMGPPGNKYFLQVDASDSDGDDISYSATNLPPGLNIDPATGVISGTISSTASSNSPYNVIIRVSDGKTCGKSTESFQWDIIDVNEPPVIHNLNDQSSAEGDSINLQLSIDNPDGDILSFSTSNLPQDLSINNTGLISGTINYEASQFSQYSVNVTVVDDGVPPLEDSINFTWTVTNTNRSPQVNEPLARTDDEGTTLEPPVQITANDPDGDPLHFQAMNLPPDLYINESTGEISGTISHFAVMGMNNKDYSVNVSVTDIADSPITKDVNFIWTVNNINGPPLMDNPGNQLNRVDDIVNLMITATDPDGDAFEFSAEGLPPNLTIGNLSGKITGMLTEQDAQGSPYSVTITTADDGTPSNNSQIYFHWIVTTGETYLPLIYR